MIGILLAAALAATAVWVRRPRHMSRGRRAGPGPTSALDTDALESAARDGGVPGGRAGTPGSPRRSGRHLQASSAGSLDSDPEASGASSRTMRGAAAAAVGVTCVLLVGGVVGMLVGLGVTVGLTVALGRLETGAQRKERLAIVADAPIAAELLSAALAAGVPLEAALPVVASAVGGPLGRRLEHVSSLIRLGQPPGSAWARLGSEESLRPLIAATSRSARTGAPLAELLAQAAGDLRQQAQTSARAEIRAAGIRAVLPLGLCLLPAFVLLGVVPLVGGLVARLW